MDLTDAHMVFKSCDLLEGFYGQLGERDLRDAMGAVLGQTEVMIESVVQEHLAKTVVFLI